MKDFILELNIQWMNRTGGNKTNKGVEIIEIRKLKNMKYIMKRPDDTIHLVLIQLITVEYKQ